MITLLILWRRFDFFVLKESFKIDSTTLAQILLCGAIHAQSKEKQTFMSQNKITLMIAGSH